MSSTPVGYLQKFFFLIEVTLVYNIVYVSCVQNSILTSVFTAAFSPQRI